MEAADGVEILVCWLSQIWPWVGFVGVIMRAGKRPRFSLIPVS